MNEKLIKRLKELEKALVFEKNQEIQDYTDSIKNKSVQERVVNGKSLFPLEYLGIRFSKFGDLLYEFSVHENQTSNQFTSGSAIELFYLENKAAKGVVNYSSTSKVSISISFYESDNDRVEDWVGKGKVGMNILPDSKTYDIYLNKLKLITDTDVPLPIQFIYDEGRSIITSKEKASISGLNESQSKVVNQILETDSPVTVIDGPPGTGKTTTIVTAIELLVKQNKKIV